MTAYPTPNFTHSKLWTYKFNVAKPAMSESSLIIVVVVKQITQNINLTEFVT